MSYTEVRGQVLTRQDVCMGHRASVASLTLREVVSCRYHRGEVCRAESRGSKGIVRIK